ncbi:MAG: hypothetical protein IKM46_07115 [Clostridia bacterium]|nr:hypothetical protein [Clostridia bacterium]
MNLISKYECVPTEKNVCGFVGMNSGKGFVGLLGEIFDESVLQKVYVIKGAPGTGKSTFMKELSKRAASCSHNVQEYLCSSDYTSLDAVVIDSKIAVVDGTSPHCYEPMYPGAVSEIIDYTKFWDNSKLENAKNEIIDLSGKKSRAYVQAYSKLKCEMNLLYERINSVRNLINFEKMRSQIKRQVSIICKSNDSGKIHRCVTRSVGMKGRVMLDCICNSTLNKIKVSDVYSSAYIYMSELLKELILSKKELWVSYDPICPELVCDIIIPQENILITVGDVAVYDKNVNMMRFVDHDSLTDIRGFLRLSDKCSGLFACETDQYLSFAGEAHFELEKIYGETMNFDYLKTYSDLKIHEILEKL